MNIFDKKISSVYKLLNKSKLKKEDRSSYLNKLETVRSHKSNLTGLLAIKEKLALLEDISSSIQYSNSIEEEPYEYIREYISQENNRDEEPEATHVNNHTYGGPTTDSTNKLQYLTRPISSHFSDAELNITSEDDIEKRSVEPIELLESTQNEFANEEFVPSYLESSEQNLDLSSRSLESS